MLQSEFAKMRFGADGMNLNYVLDVISFYASPTWQCGWTIEQHFSAGGTRLQ
jgi:hypothetical protein